MVVMLAVALAPRSSIPIGLVTGFATHGGIPAIPPVARGRWTPGATPASSARRVRKVPIDEQPTAGDRWRVDGKQEDRMTTHEVVTHDRWLAARKEYLTKEKEFTRLRDQGAVRGLRPMSRHDPRSRHMGCTGSVISG